MDAANQHTQTSIKLSIHSAMNLPNCIFSQTHPSTLTPSFNCKNQQNCPTLNVFPSKFITVLKCTPNWQFTHVSTHHLSTHCLTTHPSFINGCNIIHNSFSYLSTHPPVIDYYTHHNSHLNCTSFSYSSDSWLCRSILLSSCSNFTLTSSCSISFSCRLTCFTCQQNTTFC